MFFESGVDCPENCHEELQPALARLQSGQSRTSYEMAGEVFKQHNYKNDFSAIDWVLFSDLARMNGLFSRSDAIIRLAKRSISDHTLLDLIECWNESARGKLFRVQRKLNDLNDRLDGPLKSLALAIASQNYSIVDWQKSARKFHAKATKLAGSDPITWYVLSRASSRRTEWEQSIEEGTRAVELAPHWPRARGALIDSLVSLGRSEEAGKLIQSAGDYPLRDCRLDFAIAMHFEATGRVNDAIDSLQKLVDDWPKRSLIHAYAVRQLALLLMMKGRSDEAEKILERFDVKGFTDQLGKSEDGKRKYISVPLISQTYNHCVPTVAAMVAGAQGVEANPVEYAAAMMTRDGTPLWRMIDFMVGQGFQAHCLDSTPQVVEAMINQGVPLIGSLEGVLNSHVDVVCGYDSGLELIHIRDPMHWYGRSIKYESLSKRYHDSPGLWGMVAPNRIQEVSIEDSWKLPEGKAIIDLARAVSAGERVQAEKASALIADDHRLAFTRDSYGQRVVITPRAYMDRLKVYSKKDSEDDSPIVRIQSLLRLITSETADEILEVARKSGEEYGHQFVRYVQVHCAMAKHDWHQAESLLKEFLHRRPGIDRMWSMLATVQIEMGKRVEAQKSLSRAFEISPRTEWLHNQALGHNRDDRPFSENLEMAKQLIRDYPDSPETRVSLAEIMADCGDGLEYEQAMLDCIKYFPRDPAGYERLAYWYLWQDRTDLTKSMLEQGRELTGKDEIPEWQFELKDDGDETSEDKRPESKSDGKDASKSQSETARQNEEIVELLTESASVAMETEHDEFVQRDDVQQLNRLFSQHELPWWQAARWLAVMIENLLVDGSAQYKSEDNRVARLKEILPGKDAVPGIPETFVSAVFDAVQTQLLRSCASALLEWAREVGPNHEEFSSLSFDIAYLLETCGLYNESEEQLQRLIQRHPAYSPALYRLGQISARRSDIESAQSYFKKCLEMHPGHYSAMVELMQIAEYQDTNPRADCYLALANLLPYSQGRVYEAALRIANEEGLDKGQKFIDDRAERFQDSRNYLLQARLLTDMQQPAKARRIVEKHLSGDQHNHAKRWILADCYVQDRNYSSAAQVLRSMLDDSPEDLEVIDHLARCLMEFNPTEAKAFASEQLEKGMALPFLAFVCLENKLNAAKAAKKIVSNAKEIDRDAVANACYEAMSSHSVGELLRFLEWINKTYPHLSAMREAYALRLTTQGKSKQAMKIAEELYNKDPENPRWLGLMGRCIQDSDPGASIEYLQKAYSLAGDADSLCGIGRGYQLLNKATEAIKYYQMALAKNPYDTLAITNLAFKYERYDDELFENAVGALSVGGGIEQDYFHVICVEMAIKLNRVLPPVWLETALSRYQIVVSGTEFLDERKRLSRAIIAWSMDWNLPEIKRAVGGLIDRFFARYVWPKMAWIPPKQLEATEETV